MKMELQIAFSTIAKNGKSKHVKLRMVFEKVAEGETEHQKNV